MAVQEKRKVVCYDIAEVANVGIGTVSRVLNGSGSVSKKTREKVLKVIDKMNYKPSSAASMLARNEFKTIGLISESSMLGTNYSAGLINGVSIRLTELQYRLAASLVDSSSANDSRQLESQLLRLPMIKSRSVDGVVFDIHMFHDDFAQHIDFPYVLVNPFNRNEFNAVLPSDFEVGFLATKYLIGFGHTRIGYVPDRYSTHHSQIDRYEGYHHAMLSEGLEPIKVPSMNDNTGIFGKGQMIVLVETYRRLGCTALVAYNGIMAVFCAHIAGLLGLKIPDNMSLIGCDSDQIATDVFEITCFCFDRIKMGRIAVELLMNRVSNPSKKFSSVMVSAELIPGSSVVAISDNVQK